jgi:hypothetical protein
LEDERRFATDFQNFRVITGLVRPTGSLIAKDDYTNV